MRIDLRNITLAEMQELFKPEYEYQVPYPTVEWDIKIKNGYLYINRITH